MYNLFENIKKFHQKKSSSFPQIEKNLKKQLDLVKLALKELNEENLNETLFNFKKQPLDLRKKILEDILIAIKTRNPVHNLTDDQKQLLVLIKNPHIVGFYISNISLIEQNKLDDILPAERKEPRDIFKY